MKTNFQKTIFIVLIILLIYLPFQVFIQQLLQNTFHLGAELSFWLAHWYEVFILMFFAISLFKKWRTEKKFSSWQILLSVFFIFGLISTVFLSIEFGRGIEGFRLDLLFLLMLFLATDLPEKLSGRLLNIYLLLSVLVSLWAVIERFLPVHYWQTILSFSADFGFGNYFVGLTPRSDSVFNGPSQLSSYLLPAAGLILVKIAKAKKPALANYLYYAVILLGIGFAYSRAAWIGLITLIFLSLVLIVKDWPKRFKIAFLSFAMILIPLLTVKTATGDTATAIFTHDTSQISHEIATATALGEMKNRLNEPVKLLFGSGLGSAGPLVLKYDDGLIPESWYLQILLEIGLFGLAFWLWLMVILFLDIVKVNAGLGLGLIAVSVTALFLHTFADSPATSWTLFLLIGASLKGSSSTPACRQAGICFTDKHR